MGENNDISKLLRLKRYEKPHPAYFDDFLSEFQRRQRATLLRRPAWEILWDQISSIAPSFRVPQLAYAAMVGAAIATSVMILSPKPAGSIASAKASSSTQFSLTSSTPVTISSSTLPVAATPDGSLPPHYVLQPQPVSNERPLSF